MDTEPTPGELLDELLDELLAAHASPAPPLMVPTAAVTARLADARTGQERAA